MGLAEYDLRHCKPKQNEDRPPNQEINILQSILVYSYTKQIQSTNCDMYY
uniref:Uncharacterized protein n=1 Tax=Arundo donax TaxID=35708 RepID=A0A0A9B5C1_ARUDO